MSRRGRRDDAGAYLVLYALLAVAIFTVIALVLDIAALRQGRRADRAAADLSASAGAAVLDPLVPSSTAAACQAAWDYLVVNGSDADGAVSAPDCVNLFPTVACDPATPVTATGTFGPLTVSITIPVPDTDPLMRSELIGGDQVQSVDPTKDGAACQRVAVRVERQRSFLFGGFTGSSGGRTDVHAVARRVFQTGPDVPALVSLERKGCDGVLVDPGSSLSIIRPIPTEPDAAIVDTDLSSCPAPGAAVQLTGGTFTVNEIEAYALSGPNAPRTVAGLTAATLTRATQRLGLGFLDVRYDCGKPCGQPTGDLTRLRNQYDNGVPSGLTVFNQCVIDAATSVVVSTDAYVDCPELRVDGNVTFTGSVVVVNGNVTVGSTGCVAVNSASCDPSVAIGAAKPEVVVYVRGGVAKESTASMVLTNTFVYVQGGVTIPVADPLGASQLQWTAPQSGDFEDLLLWTESTSDVVVGEQQSTTLEGTIAAPTATVVLEGTGASTPLVAQIVANRVHARGPGPVVLSPSAARATGRVARQVRLVR